MTKPLSSRRISLGSQSVSGWAPMNTNKWPAWIVSLVARAVSVRTTRSSRSTPSHVDTSVQGRTSMLGIDSICSTRYRDIERSSDASLVAIVTRSAYWEKYAAACPAELAPPTITTCSPLHASASVAVDP
jgi:hypothetical protein